MPGDGFDALKAFLESAPAARRAAAPLSREARVNVALDGGVATFAAEAGAPELRDGAAADPDFTLTVPLAAVERIAALRSADVGELGIAFFELVVDRDPRVKVRIRIDAPTSRLLGNGYLGVLALGGAKVAWWLLRKGFRNPLAVIERLRGRR